MSRRPRIVVLGSAREIAPLRPLTESAELVFAKTAEECLELLRAGSCDGAIATSAYAAADSVVPLQSQEILERFHEGIAVTAADLTILWHNPALARLCDVANSVGQTLEEVLGGSQLVRSGECPFSQCVQGASLARSRYRLPSGKHVEVTVQPLESRERSADELAPRLLCGLRDITAEVRQQEKLVAIHRAGLELSHLTPQELAEMTTTERIDLLKANIVQYSQSILNFKNLQIRLLDPKTQRLGVLLSVGMTESADRVELYASTDGNGVTGYVAATGQSQLCDDVLGDRRYIAGARDARSSLTAPIIFCDHVIGTFNVESPEPKHFTESDKEFLEVFAREIAVALHTLDLLQAEKKFGGSASVEAILGEVGVPVDEIVADGIRVLDALDDPSQPMDAAQEAIRRILINARAVKSAIQKVGRSYRDSLEASTSAVGPQAARFAGRRVLFVDSEPAVRRSAHCLLGRVGCEVDTAKSGHEAINLAQTTTYDVVLGDIRLPDMNGYEFFATMRSELPATPIVLMTGFGYDATHSIVRARQEGLRGVLYKPFRLDRLCEAIDEALDPQRGPGRGLPNKVPAKQTVL